MKYILLILLFFKYSFASYEKSFDTKNVYFSSEHFRVIANLNHINSNFVEDYAYKSLDAAELSWAKQIGELGFKIPKNSDLQKIDIYIASKMTCHNEKLDGTCLDYTVDTANDYGGFYINDPEIKAVIDRSYAGMATFYDDYTPYFLMNPILNDNQIKVTISHEFFHTVQYSYTNFSQMSNERWFKNTWWLEATAVLMEDEVYDEINDYLNYIDSFFNYSYKSIETYDGNHEYSMVVFSKFIIEKFGYSDGMDIIKQSFSLIDSSSGDDFYELLDSILKSNYNSSIQKVLNEFSIWVSNPSKYFEEGDNYPTINKYSNTDTISIQKGGIKVIANLKKGWNMVSLPNLDMDKLDIPNLEYIWGYENNTWKNNILSSSYEKIEDANFSNGYWVKVSDDSFIPYTYYDKNDVSIESLDSGWHLLGSEENIDLNTSNYRLVWQYIDEKWYIYSSNNEIKQGAVDLGYDLLDKVLPYSSYWLYK